MIPESPRWLIVAGRDEDARAVLASIEADTADERVADIKHSIRTGHKPSLKDVWGGAFGFLPIVWIGIGVAVFQQLVGINVIFYYSSILWQSVGIDQSNSLLISLSTSIVNIIGTVLAIVLIDRVGRKPLALVGSGRHGGLTGRGRLGVLLQDGERRRHLDP